MNDTLQTIHSMHSTHGNFSDRLVSDDDIATILAASVRAANAGNAQNYAIIVSRDSTLMQEICGYQAAAVLVYCVDVQRNKDMATHLGLSYTTDPAWVLLTGTTDAALAAQNAVLAARSLGIDSLISNGLQRGDVSRFWTLLDLPPHHVFPVLAVYLGYANDEVEHTPKGRLIEPGVIHRERYQQRDSDTIDSILRASDAPDFGVFNNWREAGHTHYLEMFFKGPGGRAGSMYAGVAPALAKIGIDVSALAGDEIE